MIDNGNIFTTTSRKLEQFLYVHGIQHESWHKNEDGMTAWVYTLNPETRRIIDEYREIIRRREGKLWRK